MTFSIVAFCVNHVFTFCIFWYFDILGRSSCLERDLPLHDKLLPRDSKQLTSEWNLPMYTNPSKGPVPSQETPNQFPYLKNWDLDNRRPLLQPGILLPNVKWFDSMFVQACQPCLAAHSFPQKPQWKLFHTFSFSPVSWPTDWLGASSCGAGGCVTPVSWERKVVNCAFKELSPYHAQLLSHVQLFAALCTVDHQAPLSMGFSRQECWSEYCHFLLQGIFLIQRSNLCLISWIGRQILYHWATWEAPYHFITPD